MSTTAAAVANPIEFKTIQKLIGSGQTIVDVSPGGAEWLEAVFAQHADMRALFYARPNSEINTYLGAAADQSRAVHQGSGNTDGFDLDSDTLREGIHHIHYLHIGSTKAVRRVLKGAVRLLSHSRVDFIQFPLDTFDLWTAQTVNQLLVLSGYSILQAQAKDENHVDLKGYLLQDSEREHKVVQIIAVHQRLLPLIAASNNDSPDVNPLEVAAKRGIQVRGLIHAGASSGKAEHGFYKLLNLAQTLLIEADSGSFALLKENYKDLPGITLANCALLDVKREPTGDLDSGIASLKRALTNGPAVTAKSDLNLQSARVLDHCSFTKEGSINPVVTALSLLTPYDIDKPKVRIGPKGDGGYIMANDLSPNQTVVSYGISTEYSFDREFAERGHHVYMFDHTIDGIQATNDKMHFFREGVAGITDPSQSLFSVEDHLRRHQIIGSRLILKMDVEGWEYEAFATIGDQCLARFEQIVLEVHLLFQLHLPVFREKFCAMFRKLNKLFTLYHVHANNFDGPNGLSIVSGLPVSPLLELSYIRSTRVKRRPSQTLYPTDLDFPNTYYKDKLLWFFPFLPTPVTSEDFAATNAHVELVHRLQPQWRSNSLNHGRGGEAIKDDPPPPNMVTATTLDDLLEERKLDPKCFNAMVMDNDGFELIALRGADRTLEHIEMILTQLKFEDRGYGCGEIGELDDFLASRGFRRAYTHSSHRAWANVLYLKEQPSEEKPVETPNVLLLLHAGANAAAAPGTIFSPVTL